MQTSTGESLRALRNSWAILIATLAILVAAVATPASAILAQSSEDDEDGEPEFPLPEPLEFDLETTTHTEVERIRENLDAEKMLAIIVDMATGIELQNHEEFRDIKRDERDLAADYLDWLENTMLSAAIDGFLTDNDEQATSIIAPSLDILASQSWAEYTTDQLILMRDEAIADLAQAQLELNEAEELLDVAEAAKARTEQTLADVEELLLQFEERAEQHVRTDDRADRAADRSSPEVALRSVAGVFIVNAEIEDALDELIADARADGIELGGGGYRTVESQIALRLAHCGGSAPPDVTPPGPDATPEELATYGALAEAWRNHVIYEVPPGSCSPPTATPGNSEHQLGLAIDFTENESILTPTSPGFAWLVEHASDYGLINLPSEAWHWSTTGS